MRAKLTGGNQLILPDEVASAFHGTEYFEVVEDAGRLALTPVERTSIQEVRDKLEKLGVTELDVADAVTWARAGGT